MSKIEKSNLGCSGNTKMILILAHPTQRLERMSFPRLTRNETQKFNHQIFKISVKLSIYRKLKKLYREALS